MKTQVVKAKNSQVNVIVWIYLLAFVLMTWSFKTHAKEASATAKVAAAPVVTIDTSLGKIKVKLNPEKAPISSENFLKYVDKKFYDKTIFHRVIKDFMIQGGGHTADLKEKATLFPSITNEAKNGLSNLRGTIAMARTNDINSATAQFFINVVDNQRLDHKSEDRYGYAVFGEVIEGMDVVDKIRDAKTKTVGDYADVPEKVIVIKSIRKN
ncbi:peptidylprolyl isomerase [Pseudobdellovibrio sp. HCB154]|uniref:peptidylprolyl isomerase n=1 Tax=Pseudobdellovibrio sp. HCB154 TaxID=3386277 RepID=UPI0039170962